LHLERRKRDPVTREQFSNWKRDPVTQSMLYDVAMALVQQLEPAVPHSIDQAAAVALQRNGAIAMLEEVFTWEPRFVTDGENGGAE